MNAISLTLRGESAPDFADAFVDEKARSAERSLNKRGVRDIHRYRGDGYTQVVYERGSARVDSWLMVSMTVETVDPETVSVVLFVGGSGTGAFKLEDAMVKRVVQGSDSIGGSGRFATVLEDVRSICDSLDLTVETEWESTDDQELVEKLTSELFDS